MMRNILNRINHITLKKGQLNIFITIPSLGGYYKPFDENTVFNNNFIFDDNDLIYFNYKKIYFCLTRNKKYVDLGCIQCQRNKDNYYHYYITDVNTFDDKFKQKGITNLMFSWVILKLILINKDKYFRIDIDNSTDVKKIWNETGKYIYERIFDKNNKNVNLSGHSHSFREFPLDKRDNDYKEFKELYEKYERKLLNDIEIINELDNRGVKMEGNQRRPYS